MVYLFRSNFVGGCLPPLFLLGILMAIVIYRAGNAHVINGVTCEMGRFDVSRLQALLDDGWVTDPKQLLISEADTNNTDKLSSKEVRAAAKEAGIEGWETEKIKKLKETLGFE